MVLVLDISSSMEDKTTPSDDSLYAELKGNSAFTHTRLLNLFTSADRIITELMENNPENRVSVVVYDRKASVIMPLAHYTPNATVLEKMGTDFYDDKYLDAVEGSSPTLRRPPSPPRLQTAPLPR